MNREASSAKRAIYLMVATLFSVIYIYIYISIPNSLLRDRANYILYASDVDYFLNRYDGYDLFFNEPIFLYLNKFAFNFMDATSVPVFFVFINTFVMMLLLLKQSKNLTFFFLGLAFIIVFPYLFQAQLIAVRQTLATSLFLLAFFYFKNHWKVLACLILCSFIHSVFFLITFFYFINFIFFKKTSINYKILINSVIMLLISILFFVLLSFFGLRQADEYGEGTANVLKVGGGAFILMCAVFIGLYVQRYRLNSDLFLMVMIGLTLFVVGYFINPITGRLFNTFSPFFVLLLVSNDTKINFIILNFLVLVYGFLYFSGTYNDVFLVEYESIIDVFNRIPLGF
ncbi:EpsG family protein [Acinetobacter ursingii]|uniref:EpsG family protein n=1 Tax=Acinetobacter ursingii TaxID=108980 RepID=UPI00300A89B1